MSNHSTDEEHYSFNIALKKPKKTASSGGQKRAAKTFLKVANYLSKASHKYSRRSRPVGLNPFIKSPPNSAQRVVVKARFVRLLSIEKSRESIRCHVSYVLRDGVDLGAEKPNAFHAEGEFSPPEIDQWIEKCSADRHHFRFIISPENSQQIDMKEYVRELASKMEKDLQTRLDYLSVIHYNTDTPHAHLIVRGKDQTDKDLVIHKDYISNGIRARASELATFKLGYRSELEIREGLTREVIKDRFTQIDRDLLFAQSQHPEKLVSVRTTPEHLTAHAEFKRRIHMQRLRHLEGLSLARQTKPGLWQIRDEAESVLRDLGTRGDIIKTMHKGLTNAQAIQEKIIFDPSHSSQKNISGVVTSRGLVNELYDERKYLLLSASDNRLYYVPLSRFSELPDHEAKIGSHITVSVKRSEGQLRQADETVLSIANENRGIYSKEAHLAKVNSYRLPDGVTPQAYVENHLKRMEALEKRGLVERVGEQAWKIPSDLREKIVGMDVSGNRNHVSVHVDSMASLQKQIDASGPTWIDRQLASGKAPKPDLYQSALTRDIEQAKAKRLEVLCKMGLAEKTETGFKLRPDFQDLLYRKQMEEVSRSLSQNHGEPITLSDGARFQGEVKAVVHLPSGSHAVVSDGKRFVCVPFQRGMERGKDVVLEMTNRTLKVQTSPRTKVPGLQR